MKAKILIIALSLTLLWGCGQALQRGVVDNVYVSTARPNISLQAKGMPVMTYGQHVRNMTWTGVLGGLPIQMWLAVYGSGGLAPLAIVGQAQLPDDWIWDSDMARPFSVDHDNAVFNGATYESWIYIVPNERDPFMGLVTATRPDGQPQLWIARAFACRFNFSQDKIFMEYREPLPEDITSLSSLPLGRDSFLRDFARRALDAFVVGSAPAGERAALAYPEGIRWQYMNQNFLGTVTRLETLSWD